MVYTLLILPICIYLHAMKQERYIPHRAPAVTHRLLLSSDFLEGAVSVVPLTRALGSGT